MSEFKIDKSLFNCDAVFEPNDYLHFYKEILNEERTNNEVNFMIRELNITKPMKILDLACGHGRHSNRLAELGYDVTGVDISNGFLKIAKREAVRKKIKVDYYRKDMRRFVLRNYFDRVLLLFVAFGYFSDNENFRVLRNVSKSLKPGGLFFLDIQNRDYLVKNLPPFNIKEKGKDLMIERHYFDSDTERLYNKRIVIRNGKRKDKPFFIRLYTLTEIERLLEKAGLHIYEAFGDWDGSPFCNNSKRMILISQKIKTIK